MLGWLRKRGRLSPVAQRRLTVALARAEEKVVRTHVQNAFAIMEATGGELSMRRVLDMYLDELDIDEPQSTIITQRVLAQLEEYEEDEDD